MDCPGLILAFFLCYGISPPAEQLRSIVELFLLEESVGQDSFSDERRRVIGRKWPRGTSGPLVLDRCVAAGAKPLCSFAVSVLKERRKMCFAVDFVKCLMQTFERNASSS